MQLPCQQSQHLNQPALPNPLLEATMAGLVRRILGRHLSPLRATAENPQHAIQHCPRVVPGTAAVVLTPQRAQDRFYQLPLFPLSVPNGLPYKSAETP